MYEKDLNRSCGREDDLVAYLYHEATAVERCEFESHLLGCAACIDEFAEMSNARYSVFEWQREEFAPLATPSFSIPYRTPRTVASWAGAVRSMWGFQWPALAMAALVIIVLSGLGVWNVFEMKDHSDLKAAEQIPVAKPVMLEPSVSEEPQLEAAVAKNTEQSRLPVKAAVVRVSDVSARPRRKARRNVGPATGLVPDAQVASSSERTQPLPTLTAAIEEEDGSPRLSDLFESIDK